MSGQLTKNFHIDELKCPCCGLSSIRLDFVERLQSLRDICGFPLVISSGVRCTSHNLAVKGAPNSKHLSTPDGKHTCHAADILCKDGIRRHRLITVATELFGGIGIYNGWIHVDSRKAKVCWVK